MKNNNFAVIDIGTNAVKCINFVDGKVVDIDQNEGLKNKPLTQKEGEDLNPQEILKHIKEYIVTSRKNGIYPDKIYIVATEAFRKSTNKNKIINLIKARTGRKIHIISPKREAYLSALGGLSYIRDNYQGTPNKVLYIESGGGSTEVSLFDTSNRSFLSVQQSFSISLGSKSDVNDSELAEYDELFKMIVAKISKNDDIGIVINSSAASRILAHQYKQEKYIPAEVAKQQYSTSTRDFLTKLDEIMNMSLEDIQKNFYLGKNDPAGFISHCKILRYILQKSPDLIQNLSLTTTIGGLKHGMLKQIERAGGNEEKIREILEKEKTLTIEDNISPYKDDNNKTWQVHIKKAIKDVNAEADGRFFFKEESTNNDKILIYKDENNEKNKIQFTSQNNVCVQGDINAYYAICMTAQKLNKSINFGTFRELEAKALLYQACLEKGIKMLNPPQPDEFKTCRNFSIIEKLASKQNKEVSASINKKSHTR